jgi:hypothetical protein
MLLRQLQRGRSSADVGGRNRNGLGLKAKEEQDSPEFACGNCSSLLWKMMNSKVG